MACRVTDGLRSHKAVLREIGGAGQQEAGRWPNNCVENSHLPFRRRERDMQWFLQMTTLQKFSSVGPPRLPYPVQPGSPPHQRSSFQSTTLGRTRRAEGVCRVKTTGQGRDALGGD
ncbi:MAG: DDE-type integrase/transposase/recombinase [Proteobacteria bacterium]|nr:DDE-type integrase/transposase/recombinase [Pseudomonadota bacterium]